MLVAKCYMSAQCRLLGWGVGVNISYFSFRFLFRVRFHGICSFSYCILCILLLLGRDCHITTEVLPMIIAVRLRQWQIQHTNYTCELLTRFTNRQHFEITSQIEIMYMRTLYQHQYRKTFIGTFCSFYKVLHRQPMQRDLKCILRHDYSPHFSVFLLSYKFRL